jgi:nucleoside-specific outer membrane channel protein Tsx
MRPAVALAAGLALALPDIAIASNNATSMSALYGVGFDDVANGMASESERLFTLRLENSLSWRYGDSYIYIDMASGRFASGEGTGYDIFGKWGPRLSLSKVFGTEIAAGPIGDVLIAADVQRSAGFSALHGGLGTSLNVPGFDYLNLNFFIRDDNFNDPTYQVASSWSLPFRLGARFVFQGYVAVYGTDAKAVNVLTQPQFLIDAGELAGLGEGQLQLGAEVWIAHTADFAGEPYTTVAPQILARFTF